jgi:hypothetical protein
MNPSLKYPGEESKAELGVIFVMHQIIAIWVTIRSAPILTVSILKFLRLFGVHVTKTDYYWILVGTPYFPVQITVGLVLGWILGRHLRHRSMRWVWILPCAYLCYAVIAIPTFNPTVTPPDLQAGVGQSRLAHYFGWGCQPVNNCFDQELVTSLFYASAAYSIAAFAAEELTQATVPTTMVQFSLILTVGIVFFASAVCDLIAAVRIRWDWRLVPIAAVPAAMGAYLILLAINTRYPSASAKLPVPGTS